jgi:hypothetical protein
MSDKAVAETEVVVGGVASERAKGSSQQVYADAISLGLDI